MSWNALNLEKNQAMPNQARKPTKPKKEAGVVASSADSADATSEEASVPQKSSAPVAKAPAPAKAERPVVAKPAVVAAKKEEADATPVVAVAERAAPVARTYYTGFAMVKAVLSGDSLVLAGSTAKNGDKVPERTITLTGVQAPKFGRGKAQEDEAWAWESREYLRKHVIGQQVCFVVQHTHGDSGRDYGTVSLKEIDIATQMIKGGFVKVKTGGGKDGKIHPEKEPLLALEAEAIARGVGMHKKGADAKAHTRTIDWTPDVQALYAANKAKPIAGVVDQVRDGSTLRVELIHPSAPLKHTMITLNLAGVSCPRTPLPVSVLKEQHKRKVAEDANYKGKEPTKMEKAEPFALEAQTFTEDRLLNRDVQVLLQGVDKSNNLFGTAAFSKGNISLKLLEQGLGKMVPWSAGLTSDAEKFKIAEAAAKKQNLRIWKNFSEADAAASASGAAPLAGEFHGKVLNVPSSDSIVIEDHNGTEVRVWLASVRAPRLAGRGKDGKDEPYAQEAKEFLRSRLIGNKVRVVPEYVRESAADDKRDARTFASVFHNKVNMNEALIGSGYAEAMLHRMDEERSQYYDLYLAAEAKAKESSRGKHDPREHVVTRITDLTERIRLPRVTRKPVTKKSVDGDEADGEEESKEDEKPASAAPTKAEEAALTKNKQISAKAQQYLVFLKREKQVNAVVEFVFSASRFKLLVPKEHVLISMSLSGVRTPSPKLADGKVDPLAEEITNYVRSKIQQHSVKIEVETIDKAGNYLGSVFLNNRTNLAVDLLQQGYASIFGFSATKSPYSKELYAAERQAKDAKKGIWLNYVEPTPEEKAANGDFNDDDSKDSGPVDRVARITEIVDCSDFFVQWVGDKNAESVEKALAAVAALPDSDEPFNVPENQKRAYIAAGQFGDDTWHRIRCDGVNENGDHIVYFIDYGNHDTLLGDRIRHLPVEAQKIPALAIHAALSGLAAPKAPEYQEGSALAFSEMAFGIDLKATVDFSDKFGRKQLTLSHDSHPISVNRQLLRDGWARVQSRPDRRIQKLVNEMQEEEQHAKRNHYNMFEYGDVSDVDEEGDQVLGPDPAAKKRMGGKK
jgi:staphylococcal nuclease domain-containing protein 1